MKGQIMYHHKKITNLSFKLILKKSSLQSSFSGGLTVINTFDTKFSDL